MAVNGIAVAYAVSGGLILFSGIRGATISDTVKSALSGNLNPAGTEPIGTPQAGGQGAPGTPTNAPSGSGNYLTIAKYLTGNGYSNAAAAGICGCIAGESGGNPEAMQGTQADGGGLIQWTPISAHPGYVTGNPTKDLDTQLPGIIAYNNAQGQGLITMLNSITDPVAAADFYSENFERPAVKDSDVRASVAQSVYAQLQGGK